MDLQRTAAMTGPSTPAHGLSNASGRPVPQQITKVTPQERILEAALSRFRRWGVAKTTMGDIADAAGMQRPQLYRHFENKDALIVGAIIRQAQQLSRTRLQDFPLKGPVEPIIVETLILGHDGLLADEFAGSLMGGDDVELFLRIVRTEPSLRAAQAEWWTPVVEYGHQRNEIRLDLTVDEIVDWFLFNQITMAQQTSWFPDTTSVRHHLTNFVVPAVMRRATDQQQR
jgi:AcrR family transcriptional regulator